MRSAVNTPLLAAGCFIQRFLKSKAIIEYREKSGAFTSVDDLAKVSGIGPRTIKQLRDAATIEGEKSAEAPAKLE
ncbi:MAG TPA: helix-hairpin-helix domain-containing protein [Anaerolineales bacterium]|nr:helix-hairpin-helix domain-containing protein [Anaerolineales bacterium]